MVIIGINTSVANATELKALTGYNNQDFVYHVGENCAYMFRNNVATGDYQSDDLSGWWVKDLKVKCFNLEGYKEYRFEQVNLKSRDLITNGHSYGGFVFSLSENAQRNLLGLFTGKDYLTYPMEYRTKDDLNKVFLNNATDVTNFYFSAMGTIQAHLASGNALKQQINDATTVNEVQLIIDNR